MLKRRDFLVGALSANLVGNLPDWALDFRVATISDPSESADTTGLVNVFAGTGGHGHTFPGATVPFGAVQLSPDTGTREWDWCSGYHYDDDTLLGFSHTHLSGTGIGDMLDLLLVPRTGDVILRPGIEPEARRHPEGTYRSRFSHQDERGEPGYYTVLTEASRGERIRTELTATERTGLARFSFPEGVPAYLLLDWHHVYGTENEVRSAELSIVGERAIQGGRRVSKWAPDREIYFASELDIKPTRIELFQDDALVSSHQTTGRNCKLVLHFLPGATVQIKTGISMVSAANARLNLENEQPGFHFEQVRAKAKARWQQELSRIRVEDRNRERKVIFYTALYHMMCAPTLADDVNGEYRGFDKRVHKLDAEQRNYSTFSLWDTYRALHPSFTLWQSDRVAAMVNCLIRIGEQSIYGFPIWPLQDGETYCMQGYHGASVMAEACVKKVQGIDWQRAYATMRQRNMVDHYAGLDDWRVRTYVPADCHKESVGQMVEYTYCDWACSHVALATGNHNDARVQRLRALYYRQLFDPELQFIRAKMSGGEWAPNFDPRSTGHLKHVRDYTEANAWQSTFFVQHDVAGYMKLFGGREAFCRKLDDLFAAESGVSNEKVADMTGFIGQYVHGNEPSHHITYLYLWGGQPWKTQKLVRQLLLTHYHDDPDGLDGNEDCGQMSAWYVMSALGLYAVDPVSGTYVLNAPIFDRVHVSVGGGRVVTIEAHRKDPETDIYIQKITVNGQVHDRLWIEHATLTAGAHVVFFLGPEPALTFATGQDKMPPSMTT